MSKVLTKLLALFKNKEEDLLARLIKDGVMRESILGVGRFVPASRDTIDLEAKRIISYARSEEYAIYADKLWKNAFFYIKCLADINLKPEEVGFYRGCLKSTMDDLKISYEAFQYLENEKKALARGDSPTPGR